MYRYLVGNEIIAEGHVVIAEHTRATAEVKLADIRLCMAVGSYADFVFVVAALHY